MRTIIYFILILHSCSSNKTNEVETKQESSNQEIILTLREAYESSSKGCISESKSIFLTEESNCNVLSNESTFNDKLEYYECRIVERINSGNKSTLLEHVAQGGIGSRSYMLGYNENYISFMALVRTLNFFEFQQMMQDSCPTIRYYGFLAICMNHPKMVVEELKKSISDSTVVVTRFGCLEEEIALSSLYYKTVTHKYRNDNPDHNYQIYQLSESEKAEIDSIKPKYTITIKH